MLTQNTHKPFVTAFTNVASKYLQMFSSKGLYDNGNNIFKCLIANVESDVTETFPNSLFKRWQKNAHKLFVTTFTNVEHKHLQMFGGKRLCNHSDNVRKCLIRDVESNVTPTLPKHSV